MDLPVWLKCTILVIILIAQTGWILNCLKKIAQAIGLYKSDEQLARIFLEKERLRAQRYSAPVYVNTFQEPRQTPKEVKSTDMPNAESWRDVTPEPKQIPFSYKLLTSKK